MFRLLQKRKNNRETDGHGTSDEPQKPIRKINLNLQQVFDLSMAAFRARSFPDLGMDSLAHNIVWLEARRIPGLSLLASEFTTLNSGCWLDRQPRPGPDKQMVFDCPFIAGTILQDYFEQLVLPDPEEVRGIMGPTNPMLLLPRIAHYSAKIGSPITVYFKGGRPLEFVGSVITSSDKIFMDGDIRKMWGAEGLSFSRFDGQMPDQAHGTVCKTATISEAWMLSLAEFIARDEVDARPN